MKWKRLLALSVISAIALLSFLAMTGFTSDEGIKFEAMVKATNSDGSIDFPLFNENRQEGGRVFLFRDSDNKLFLYSASALCDPPDSMFYESWLLRPGTNDKVPTGKLTKNEHGDYENAFFSDNSFPDFEWFMITLEKNDDGIPEKFILFGNGQSGDMQRITEVKEKKECD